MERIEFRAKDFTYSSSMLERDGEKDEREEVEKLRIHPPGVGQSKLRNTNGKPGRPMYLFRLLASFK